MMGESTGMADETKAFISNADGRNDTGMPGREKLQPKTIIDEQKT
jgi:hypothetical protein